jgi:uncharacterized glyoxalase superfamily protein PhnB
VGRKKHLSTYLSALVGFTLGHIVVCKIEVDPVVGQALAAGARLVKPAGDTFWGGYAGYLQDPDGRLWEVAWNPVWELED